MGVIVVKQKMTAMEVANTARALSSLNISCRISYRDARDLQKLKAYFSDQAAIVIEQEVKLVDTYGGTLVYGKPRFNSPDSAVEFSKAHYEMLNDSDEFEFEPVNLSAYIDHIELAQDAVLALDGIIIIEDNVT